MDFFTIITIKCRVYDNENVCVQTYDEPKGILSTRKTLSNRQELLFDVWSCSGFSEQVFFKKKNGITYELGKSLEWENYQ